MKLQETLHLPLSATAAAAMYADPEYPGFRRETLHARTAESEVDGDPAGAFTVSTRLELPTDKVPDMARPFIGSSLVIRERQEWEDPAADGSRRGRATFTVEGTPASMTATLSLVPDGEDAAQVRIDGDLVAKVPLLGPRLEKAALPYVSSVLTAEQRSAAAYRKAKA